MLIGIFHGLEMMRDQFAMVVYHGLIDVWQKEMKRRKRKFKMKEINWKKKMRNLKNSKRRLKSMSRLLIIWIKNWVKIDKHMRGREQSWGKIKISRVRKLQD